jgi:hypothetical protein
MDMNGNNQWPVSEKTLDRLILGRKVWSRLFPGSSRFGYTYDGATVKGQAASDLIRNALAGPKPAMISRIGIVELNAVMNHRNALQGRKPTLVNHLGFITGRFHSYGWEPGTLESMPNNAGFFPGTREALAKFAERMMADIPLIDILGTCHRQEWFVAEQLRNAVKVPLPDLEPHVHADPWSTVLEGKKVLVVHPYEKTIRSQYEKRALLFKDRRFLPDFDLKTVKAVQTIANTPSEFPDWFHALDHMKEQIDRTDYDIAILGCGAYGLPLAAHIKRRGRKAVHLGGSTQFMFGIIGKRWEGNPLINEHWVRPAADETPALANKVEGGCYW